MPLNLVLSLRSRSFPPDQLAKDKTMTRNARSLSGAWAESTKANHYNAPPSQSDFYALLGVTYLLLIAGGFFAICLSVISLTDH
jgi:hypothetical protein